MTTEKGTHQVEDTVADPTIEKPDIVVGAGRAVTVRAKASRVANLIAAAAVAVGAAALSASLGTMLTTDTFSGFGRGESETLVELRETTLRRTNDLHQRLKVVEEAIENSENEDLVIAGVASKTESNAERLDSIENLLDLQPRQLIEVSRLRDEISDLRDEVFARQSQLTRELDRAFNLMLALVGALLVAVVAMVVSNYLSRGREQ